MRVLVVEDEQKVAAFIKEGLEQQGFAVDVAYDGYVGERLAVDREYHVILLDIIIPLLNGLELCKRIRAARPGVSILMLTALGTTDDKVVGFDAGADDYLVKPFEFKELVARVKALAKRRQSGPQTVSPFANTLTVGDLVLDLDRKVAMRGDRTISLTAKEFGLLEYLMRNKGRVVSRNDISEHVWDVNFESGTNVVEVYVNILRKKIDKDFQTKLIHTRIGLGYIMHDQV